MMPKSPSIFSHRASSSSTTTTKQCEPNTNELYHMNENHVRLSPALVETIAGLSAGTISTLVVHPLDVVKTRLQSILPIHSSFFNTNLQPPTVHRNEHKAPTSIVRSLLSSPKPIQSLYRGLSPNLIGNAGSWAIFFYFKSVVETQLLNFHNRRQGVTETSKKKSTLTPGDYFLASGISGAIITLSTNPIWVLKTRMLSSDKGDKGAYDNMWQGARQIFKTEGVKGFYKGTAISLVGVSHGAVQFGVYEPLKKTWRRFQRNQSQEGGEENEKLSNAATLFISGAAKIVAGSVTYPYQVIRSRLQTYDAEERFGRGIRKVAVGVWREAGWRGFYRGLGTNIVRVLPATWVTFLVYENVRFYLPGWVA